MLQTQQVQLIRSTKGYIEIFGSVLALRCKKGELNKSLDVFIENLLNYIIIELENA